MSILKGNIVMTSFLPTLIYRFNAIPYKSKKTFTVEICKLTLKIIKRLKGLRIAKQF